jgi:SlyX protein
MESRWASAVMASNHAMAHLHDTDLPPAAIDRRLTDLEIKASYAEDLLDALNRIVAEQASQLDRLTRELGHLRQQAAESGSAVRSLRDELPPHW